MEKGNEISSSSFVSLARNKTNVFLVRRRKENRTREMENNYEKLKHQ